MIKLFAICRHKKFHIQILGWLLLFVSQSVFAESVLQKSLLELKKAIQEQVQKSSGEVNELTKLEAPQQKASIDDVFGVEPQKEEPKVEYYWKTKAELFEAVNQDKMPKLDGHEFEKANQLTVSSIALILAKDYKTPVIIEKSSDLCEYTFRLRVPFLLYLVKQSKESKFSEQPPNFVGNDKELVENNNNLGRIHFNTLSEHCSPNNLGSRFSYPFIGSLASLLKEYSDVMEEHVQKLRLAKVERYKIAEEKTRITKAEKDLADSQAKILENQANVKAQRERQFQDDFSRKEKIRQTECLSSTEYARFATATSIQENLLRAKVAKESISKEKEIGRASGYEDMGKLNELGRMQVYAQDNVSKAYKEYRKYGGKATSPNNTIAGQNPCL